MIIIRKIQKARFKKENWIVSRKLEVSEEDLEIILQD